MLSELVRKYSKSLPLRVRVDEGFCGSEERLVGVACGRGLSGHECFGLGFLHGNFVTQKIPLVCFSCGVVVM